MLFAAYLQQWLPATSFPLFISSLRFPMKKHPPCSQMVEKHSSLQNIEVKDEA